MGALVFANPQALAWLNAAIHPLIRQRVTQAIAQHRENGVEVAVVDAALLYQARWDDLADEIWVVSAPPGIVADRLRERGMTADDIRRRTEAQAGAEAAFARADVIIDNYGFAGRPQGSRSGAMARKESYQEAMQFMTNQLYQQHRIEEYFIEEEPFYLAVADEITIFEAAYAQRVPILLKGPTGSGKTRFVEYMSVAVERLPQARRASRDGLAPRNRGPATRT